MTTTKKLSIRLSPAFDALVTRWQQHRKLPYKAQALYELIALGYQAAQRYGEMKTGEPDGLTWDVDILQTNAIFDEYEKAFVEQEAAWKDQHPDAPRGAYYATQVEAHFEVWFAKAYGVQRGGIRAGAGRKPRR
jgi:hypothetical protein